MNKGELIEYIDQNDSGMYDGGLAFKLDIHHLGKQIQVFVDNIVSTKAEPEISILAATLLDILAFNPRSTDWFIDKIWDHYKHAIENGWFGFVNYEGFENSTEANYSHFKVRSIDHIYETLDNPTVIIRIENDGNRYFALLYDCPWDSDHGLSIGIFNNQFDYFE